MFLWFKLYFYFSNKNNTKEFKWGLTHLSGSAGRYEETAAETLLVRKPFLLFAPLSYPVQHKLKISGVGVEKKFASSPEETRGGGGGRKGEGTQLRLAVCGVLLLFVQQKAAYLCGFFMLQIHTVDISSSKKVLKLVIKYGCPYLLATPLSSCWLHSAQLKQLIFSSIGWRWRVNFDLVKF